MRGVVDVENLVARCRDVFPAVVVEHGEFAAYLAERRPNELTPSQWLDAVHAEDCFLACACLRGQRAALDAFELRFGGDIDRALHQSSDRRGIDDAKQILMQRLFVGTANAGPKIGTYSGRGPLRRWLRVVAGRLLLEVVAAREPIADDWEIASVPVTDADPELAYLKARYRSEYKQIFEDAMSRLTARERTVLAQYHVDSLTIDQLGTLYNVHRVTASRWVLKAQTRLREVMLEQLRGRLGLSTTDLHSITRLVRSELSLSLVRVLGG